MRDYLRYVGQGIPLITGWVVVTAFLLAGAGFLVLELFRVLGGAMGYTWARLLTGTMCFGLGALGVRSVIGFCRR